MTIEMVQMQFHGDVLWSVERDGQAFVALRPICAALGLDWSAQYRRVMRDAVLAPSVAMMATETADGERQAVFLPLEYLNGWLFGIDDRRIANPEAREKVLTYKRECYRVLFKHFHARARTELADQSDFVAPEMDELDISDVRAWTALISECRVTWGRVAARSLWRQSPLPQPGEVHGDSDIDTFLTERMVADETVLTPAALLYQTYRQWCGVNGGAVASQTMFGSVASGRLEKVRRGCVFYAARIV